MASLYFSVMKAIFRKYGLTIENKMSFVCNFLVALLGAWFAGNILTVYGSNCRLKSGLMSDE